MLNNELFGLLDVVAMIVDIHLALRPCVVYGEFSLVLPVSCSVEIAGSICFLLGVDAMDSSQRSRSRSPKVFRAAVLQKFNGCLPEVRCLQLLHLKERGSVHDSPGLDLRHVEVDAAVWGADPADTYGLKRGSVILTTLSVKQTLLLIPLCYLASSAELRKSYSVHGGDPRADDAYIANFRRKG